MTISFEQAMSTLESMFHTLDRDVIRVVLESNGGHMERTVECLLSMQGDPSIQQEQRAPQPADQQAAPKRSGGGLHKPLPDDFLRPPSYFKKHKNLSQVEEDALVAQMLQDEMFMRELVRHQDYVAGHRQHRGGSRQQQQQPRPSQSQQPPQAVVVPNPAPVSPRNAGPNPIVVNADGQRAPAAGAAAPQPTSSFKERWSSISDAAKRKMAEIAQKFRREDAAVNPRAKGTPAAYMSLPSMDDELRSGDVQFQIDSPDDAGKDIPLQDRRFIKDKKSESQLDSESDL